MAVVVIGVDGSEDSLAALRFAAAEAELREAKLRVVCAWHVPTAVYAGGWAPPVDMTSGFETAARDVASRAMSEVARQYPGVDRESKVVEGQAAEVLLRASEDADLLVVGSRGLGGFKSLLLGSVSQQVVHHATCPVAIVPHAEQGASQAESR
jgi:nucleotide-binding universal stress UspA family protein